ncbi:MAG: hypothetical protein V7L29_23515 [Nostoc sp.]|uniref:hypothetical protein n=1 Tax=Nostoc sp. TaxID=1180 RepID=UPI002FF7A4CB
MSNSAASSLPWPAPTNSRPLRVCTLCIWLCQARGRTEQGVILNEELFISLPFWRISPSLYNKMLKLKMIGVKHALTGVAIVNPENN